MRLENRLDRERCERCGTCASLAENSVDWPVDRNTVEGACRKGVQQCSSAAGFVQAGAAALRCISASLPSSMYTPSLLSGASQQGHLPVIKPLSRSN